MEASIDLQSIESRMNIRDAVQHGDMEAIMRVNDLNHEVSNCWRGPLDETNQRIKKLSCTTLKHLLLMLIPNTKTSVFNMIFCLSFFFLWYRSDWPNFFPAPWQWSRVIFSCAAAEANRVYLTRESWRSYQVRSEEFAPRGQRAPRRNGTHDGASRVWSDFVPPSCHCEFVITCTEVEDSRRTTHGNFGVRIRAKSPHL